MLKRIFTNRFFIIAVCSAVLISIIPSVLFAMGQGDFVRSALQTAAAPFEWCFARVGEGLNGFPEYFRTLSSLREENRELREQIARMQSEVYDAKLLNDENNFLRTYLATKAEHIDFEFTDASVIGYSVSDAGTECTLSKGSLAGIAPDMPVITEKGLIGRISEVGATWSRVSPMTETDNAVGAYAERSGVSGVVEGTLSLRLEGLCRMVYLPAGADIREGDILVTTGLGSFYPRGITVGRVTEVSDDPLTRTLVATVLPAADLSEVHQVMIVTSFTGLGDDRAE